MAKIVMLKEEAKVIPFLGATKNSASIVIHIPNWLQHRHMHLMVEESLLVTSNIPNFVPSSPNKETTLITVIAIISLSIIVGIITYQFIYREESTKIFISHLPFNNTESITNSIPQTPIMQPPYEVEIENSVEWFSKTTNPRVVIGLWEDLSSPSNPSIQIVMYENGALDVVVHNSTYPNGERIAGILGGQDRWVNPILIKMGNEGFSVSSLDRQIIEHHTSSFKGFRLNEISAGSTQRDYALNGQVILTLRSTAFPSSLLWIAIVSAGALILAVFYLFRNRLKKGTIGKEVKEKQRFKKRRGEETILYDILKAIQDENSEKGVARPTALSRKANLPYDRLKNYLRRLSDLDMIEYRENSCIVTKKGLEYMSEHEKRRMFLNNAL